MPGHPAQPKVRPAGRTAMPWCLASAGMIAATDDKGTRSDVHAPVPAGYQARIKSATPILTPVVVALWLSKGRMEQASTRRPKAALIESKPALGTSP
jgi:hypothetical protein